MKKLILLVSLVLLGCDSKFDTKAKSEPIPSPIDFISNTDGKMVIDSYGASADSSGLLYLSNEESKSVCWEEEIINPVPTPVFKKCNNNGEHVIVEAEFINIICRIPRAKSICVYYDSDWKEIRSTSTTLINEKPCKAKFEFTDWPSCGGTVVGRVE